MIGDFIRTTKSKRERGDDKKLEDIEPVEGTVIFENEHFYTVQGKNYRTSINKVAVYVGDVSISD